MGGENSKEGNDDKGMILDGEVLDNPADASGAVSNMSGAANVS
jgi:hypothetical protein